MRLGAEALELGDAAGLAGGLELVEVVHAELVVEGLDLLRPQTADAQHLQQAGRRLLRAGRRRKGSVPVVTSVVILSRRVSPMPRTLGELAGGDEFAEVAFELFEGAGGVVVGVAAEGVFALKFQQRADLVEDGGDFFFVHGGRTGWGKGND